MVHDLLADGLGQQSGVLGPVRWSPAMLMVVPMRSGRLRIAKALRPMSSGAAKENVVRRIVGTPYFVNSASASPFASKCGTL
ncbi:hypothetical protein JOF29_006583 [Kribbella aluminosa]|uniref:Uncharacterized protein n=1 Tax=Kribbella aluminosa TaxID=416017 RepID=A0ABS4UV10_9ACTN|nr:hypothetical protein [Kribbella aluminosa]MBP2355473.1 hypothetical protein [Kribbella aluminosa]